MEIGSSRNPKKPNRGCMCCDVGRTFSLNIVQFRIYGTDQVHCRRCPPHTQCGHRQFHYTTTHFVPRIEAETFCMLLVLIPPSSSLCHHLCSDAPASNAHCCDRNLSKCLSTAKFESINLSTQFCMHASSLPASFPDDIDPVIHFLKHVSVSSWTDL